MKQTVHKGRKLYSDFCVYVSRAYTCDMYLLTMLFYKVDLLAHRICLSSEGQMHSIQSCVIIITSMGA